MAVSDTDAELPEMFMSINAEKLQMKFSECGLLFFFFLRLQQGLPFS